MLKQLPLLLTVFFFQSCCYHLETGESISHGKKISIPYVEGDIDGHLTSEIIRAISTSSPYNYVNQDSDVTLKIKLIDTDEKNIGYRYDRKYSGNLKDSLIPAESRSIAVAEVLLLDSVSGDVLKGPIKVRATVDFDYDYYKIEHKMNVFSLGQVNDIESARDAVRYPLDSKLAGFIIDYLVNSP